jgi:hypothetical protein
MKSWRGAGEYLVQVIDWTRKSGMVLPLSVAHEKSQILPGIDVISGPPALRHWAQFQRKADKRRTGGGQHV